MSYREGAERFYDLFGAKDDAPFYIELANRHGDKALELGVGTARLAIQLAREGVETWGGFHAEILKEPVHWENGYILPPTGPGLGVELNEEVAEAHPYLSPGAWCRDLTKVLASLNEM